MWDCCRSITRAPDGAAVEPHTLLHSISTFCWAFHCWFRMKMHFKGLTFFVKDALLSFLFIFFVIFMALWINMLLSNTDTLSLQTGNSLFPLAMSQSVPTALGVPWNHQSPFIFNFLSPFTTTTANTFKVQCIRFSHLIAVCNPVASKTTVAVKAPRKHERFI